jgi:predicted secreted protein
MATSGRLAFATTLYYVPRSGAKTAIAELRNIDGVELSADNEEFTSHDSTDRYREFEQGLREPGSLAIGGNHLPTDDGQAMILTHFDDDTDGGNRYLEVEFPDGAGFNFYGHVTNYKPADAPVDDALQFSATYKLSGKPIWGEDRATGLTTPFFALSEGDGTVDPAKASDTYEYTADVANGVSSLTITPTSSGGDSIYVEDELVTSGDASSAISLDVGDNVLTIIVYEDGYLPARYEITVTRAAS